MRITLFDRSVDQQDVSEHVAERFFQYFEDKYLEWFGHDSGQEWADFRAELAYFCVGHWCSVVESATGLLDSALRDEGCAITISVSDFFPKADSERTGRNEWNIHIPLSWFPMFYSAAISVCEIEDEKPGLMGRWSRMSDAEFAGGARIDPIDRPLALLPYDLDGRRAPKYREEALHLAVTALLLVVLHELAHCLLGHHQPETKQRTASERRAVEVEADQLAGIFFAILDQRTPEQAASPVPTWSEAHATNFFRACNLLAIITRYMDQFSDIPEEDRHHHRATTRYVHLATGAAIRFHTVNPAVVPMLERQSKEVLAMFTFSAMGTSMERYVDLESAADWESYERITRRLAQRISALYREKRVPILGRILRGIGVHLDANLPAEPSSERD